MERSVKTLNADLVKSRQRDARPVAVAAWHGLFWLVFANAVGVMIAILLLVPSLNQQLGEWTYGRWIMVHMNLMLYGWTSVPLVGFLFRAYGADRGATSRWCRPVIWTWSAALGIGTLSWLSGYSSGKLFLDWEGYARSAFFIALVGLWLFLCIALVQGWSSGTAATVTTRVAQLIGLVLLLAVPFLIFIASNPNLYPAVNPDTGGPTGTSQLESSLAVVLILLLLPYGLAPRKTGKSRAIAISWIMLVAEFILLATLSRGDASHHEPIQFLSLGSLLVWLPLIPLYYSAFEWHPNTRHWRLASLWWWAALLVTGWTTFLPGLLDHMKFTDGLVGHSFIAMAGFTSSLIIFVMVQLFGDGGWIFNRTRSFHAWHTSVVAYIVVITMAGWREGYDPAFTIVPGTARNVLYTLRLITGVLMLLAATDWLVDATTLLNESETSYTAIPQEKTA